MSFNTSLIIDTEEAMQILRECGSDAFAVYCFLEARQDCVTVEEVSSACSLTVADTERALQRLGDFQLGIRRDSGDGGLGKVVGLGR